ncbi:MAG: sigma 54-interacting transcriptional regulator [Ignavibacteria bacterium]|nr:sigma 54-interacting transcriptional regulator [Ignavibacteria bacterium]
MTHTVSFTTARYTNLQTLILTDHAHLLRSFDTERDEHVLIRVFRTSNEAEQSYILTEAAALSKLSSPHIAMLYDVNITANNEPYIAFENLQHIPLDTVPHSQFSNTQFIVQMAASLLTALAPLHAQMRALLCLTPSSIRLADEESPVARIALDEWFPLAGDSVARAVYGAHNPYAAPELALQRTADARADLFSIGITLYETITGQSFNDVAMVESSGMLSHLVLKSLRESAPALPDALVQWVYALLERDRSMRFFSAREALEYLATHGLLAKDILNGMEQTPVSLVPVSGIGLETALAAVVNIQSPFVESPVLEISGEPGLGKTMLLRLLVQSRLESITLLRHKIVYFAAIATNTLPKQIREALEKQEPTLFLVDDAEQMPEDVRLEVKDLLALEDTSLAGIRVVATHRSQLARLAAKPAMLTLSNFAPSHVPLFCAELLGRCAFTPEFYRQLYARTKGHPLVLAMTVRAMVQSGSVKRRNRIWTNDAQEEDYTPPVALSLGSAALDAIRLLPDDARTMFAAVLAALRVCEPLHLPVSLHLLAEMLDTSTQSALRRLLPLTFDGFVQLHNSAVECTHEIFRETATSVFAEDEFKNFQRIAHELVQNRHPHLFLQEVTAEEKPHAENPQEEKSHAEKSQQEKTQQHDKETQARIQGTSQPNKTAASVSSVEAHSVDANIVSEHSAPSSGATVQSELAQGELAQSEPVQNEPNQILPEISHNILVRGESPAAEFLRKNVEIAVSHDVPCLIESVYGGYREELATLLHTSGNRRERPFHALSCADFEGTELESYLFDTGTDKGLIAESEGGTIFLDEISSAPMTVQLRLARVAQTLRKQSKIPSPRPTLPDVRLIVGYTVTDGTRADAAMRLGTISSELFFAVGAVRIMLPALGDRREDIPLLARYYAENIAAEYGINLNTELIPAAFWKKLSAKTWIADMTELEANMRSLVLQFDPKRIEVSIFAVEEQLFGEASSSNAKPIVHAMGGVSSLKPPPTAPDDDLLLSIDDAQKEHILRALELTGGNKTKAAEMLRIKRTTLLARMKKFGLMP